MMSIYGHISYTTYIYVYEYLYIFIKKDDEHIWTYAIYVQLFL